MEAKLKNACKKCSDGTLRVYNTNIRRLYRMFSEKKKIKTLDEIPDNSRWLMSEKLEKAYKALPNNIRRHLSSAGFIATKLYKNVKEDNRWRKFMNDDAKEYDEKRSKNKKSAYEEANIPKNGLKDLIKATKDYKRQIKRVFSTKPSLQNLYKYQLFLALKFMTSDLVLRNDLPTLNVEDDKGNYIKKTKNSYSVVMTEFKNSSKLGPREIKLSRANSMALKQFLQYRDKLVEHDFLFSSKAGKPLSKKAFSQALIKLTNTLLGKRVGSRLIRVMVATKSKDILEAADEISNKMLHAKGGNQTRQYVRKN
jgi:hypothetical protein